MSQYATGHIVSHFGGRLSSTWIDSRATLFRKWKKESPIFSMIFLMTMMVFSTNGSTLEPNITTPSPKWCQMKFVSFFVQPSEFFHLNQCSLFTQENLNKHKVTVYSSNCTSINGKLVVAGYILLRAPMMTHRLHYLCLWKMLPPTTTPFQIFPHKRKAFPMWKYASPLTQQGVTWPTFSREMARHFISPGSHSPILRTTKQMLSSKLTMLMSDHLFSGSPCFLLFWTWTDPVKNTNRMAAF